MNSQEILRAVQAWKVGKEQKGLFLIGPFELALAEDFSPGIFGPCPGNSEYKGECSSVQRQHKLLVIGCLGEKLV